MKILLHRADNTAYAKSICCKKFLSFCGIDFYFSEDLEENTREYFCHIRGTADLLKPLGLNCYSTVEQAETAIKSIPEEKIISFCTVEGELKRIENACERGAWTSNADIYFCELMGKYEFAERARKNRADIYAQREREEREEAKREEEERQEREEAAARERADRGAKAERELRAGNFISPSDFELLAEKYGVKLPIKFVGWLREWSGNIQIKKREEEAPQGVVFESKYETRYRCYNNHQSTSIWKYADALADAIGL